MGLQVIGTGFGRTGTESMRLALNRLGFGPTHHMHEVNADPKQKAMWRALMKGAKPDWDLIFNGYGACVDWPSAHWWRDLVAYYPEAKVILTHRSAESWWKSFERTILQVYRTARDPDSFAAFLPTVLGGDPADRDTAIAAYRRNVEDVLSAVPNGRLLVHELGSGWEPLCDFLGVGVPDEPYPVSNNAEQFHS
ncbi:sulfotransferase family protein [Defluviimonas sp. WL0002]|uniref:Sulfotransferase family protein n=1 Tax=Albidovulum marisflavi TaxID=2984159 RepID=A0ABT2Z7K2_9RHOB|nr:sulfotransferase family protein [Defluviimonas sp. WL0002]MCV2867124.1 sulfotransferase family protein [Defluviimonas sp. WL0002]